MGFFKRLRNFFLGTPTPPPPSSGRHSPPSERTPSTTDLPSDAKVTIARTWKDGKYRDTPWTGWKDDDIVGQDQVIVHVEGGGLDYYRTVHGPFADNAVDSVIDLTEAEFWNPSP